LWDARFSTILLNSLDNRNELLVNVQCATDFYLPAGFGPHSLASLFTQSLQKELTAGAAPRRDSRRGRRSCRARTSLTVNSQSIMKYS
jgi:hypothetical protein